MQCPYCLNIRWEPVEYLIHALRSIAVHPCSRLALNTIILIYFLVANAVYTVLMVLSLYAVSIHSRFASHTGYMDLMDSPVTPPVALIVPAFNEQDVIVATVESMLELKYPEKEVIVVDDGSHDATLLRLIERFHLQKMDLIYRSQLPANAPTAFFYNREIPELLVVTKPAGMLVHPTCGIKSGTLANALAYHLNRELIEEKA